MTIVMVAPDSLPDFHPDAFDTAAYARDIALNLQAMAASAGMPGLAALFRAAAAEAAETLVRLREVEGDAHSARAASARRRQLRGET